MKITNNQIDILLDVFEKEYPETAKNIKSIQFAKVKKVFAVTYFSPNGEINIFISDKMRFGSPMTIETATELLAHELAHAIVGESEKHGEKWEKQFSELLELYVTEASKRVASERNGE